MVIKNTTKPSPEQLRRGSAFDHIKCHRQVWNTWGGTRVTRCYSAQSANIPVWSVSRTGKLKKSKRQTHRRSADRENRFILRLFLGVPCSWSIHFFVKFCTAKCCRQKWKLRTIEILYKNKMSFLRCLLCACRFHPAARQSAALFLLDFLFVCFIMVLCILRR